MLPVWGEVVDAVNRAAMTLSGFLDGSKTKMAEWSAWGTEKVRAIIATVQNLGESFGVFLGSASAASAGSLFKALGDGASWAFGVVKQGVDTAAFVLRNFDDLTALAGISIVEAFTNGAETIKWAGGVAEDFGTYLAGNWRTLATDAMNAVSAAVKNLGSNIAALLDALAGLARGEGFEVKLKPVLEGFNPKAEGFHVRERVLSNMNDQKEQIQGNIARREANWKGGAMPAAAGAQGAAVNPAGAPGAPAAGGKSAKEFKPEIFHSGQEYWESIQTSMNQGAAQNEGFKGIVKLDPEGTQQLKATEKAETKVANNLTTLDKSITKLTQQIDVLSKTGFKAVSVLA